MNLCMYFHVINLCAFYFQIYANVSYNLLFNFQHHPLTTLSIFQWFCVEACIKWLQKTWSAYICFCHWWCYSFWGMFSTSLAYICMSCIGIQIPIILSVYFFIPRAVTTNQYCHFSSYVLHINFHPSWSGRSSLVHPALTILPNLSQ